MVEFLLAVELLQFTGPDNQRIDINPAMIISVRNPRSTDHFAPGTRCLLFTTDGKNIPVQEDCAYARLKLMDRDDPNPFRGDKE